MDFLKSYREKNTRKEAKLKDKKYDFRQKLNSVLDQKQSARKSSTYILLLQRHDDDWTWKNEVSPRLWTAYSHFSLIRIRARNVCNSYIRLELGSRGGGCERVTRSNVRLSIESPGVEAYRTYYTYIHLEVYVSLPCAVYTLMYTRARVRTHRYTPARKKSKGNDEGGAAVAQGRARGGSVIVH